MREVERVIQHCTRTDTIPTKGPWNISRWSVGSILLLAECTPVSRWLSSMPIVCVTIRYPLFDHSTPCTIWLSHVSQKWSVCCTTFLTYCWTKKSLYGEIMHEFLFTLSFHNLLLLWKMHCWFTSHLTLCFVHT